MNLPRLRLPALRAGAIALGVVPLVIAAGVGQQQWPMSLPPCLFQKVFGFPAPSCGLTRSFLALMRGDWQTALEYHLFGPLVMGLLVGMAILATIELLTRRSFALVYQQLLKTPAIVFIGVFLSYYGLRLWARYTLPSLPWGFDSVDLWQHFLAGALAL